MVRQPVAAFVLLLLALAACAEACLWDKDTAAAEARNQIDVVDAIAGRIERNPPPFYEMRLERVARELELQPDNLELHDDAAVAAERLGRTGEAIEWMARKKTRMDAMKEAPKDAAYRYLANLGTFHAHRWVGGGARRDDRADLEKARSMIAEAISLNPNAHFGRERYQLMAIEWLLQPLAEAARGGVTDPWFVPLGGMSPSAVANSQLVNAGYGDIFTGIVGLMAQGSASESIDAFRTLQMALVINGESSLAYMAQLRIEELEADGKRSLRSDTVLLAEFASAEYRLSKEDKARVQEAYVQMRANAKKWQEARTAYMMARMRSGKHPDTDADFWQGYREIPRAEIRESKAPWLDRDFASSFALIVSSAVAAVLAARWILAKRRHA